MYQRETKGSRTFHCTTPVLRCTSSVIRAMNHWSSCFVINIRQRCLHVSLYHHQLSLSFYRFFFYHNCLKQIYTRENPRFVSRYIIAFRLITFASFSFVFHFVCFQRCLCVVRSAAIIKTHVTGSTRCSASTDNRRKYSFQWYCFSKSWNLTSFWINLLSNTSIIWKGFCSVAKSRTRQEEIFQDFAFFLVVERTFP